MAFSLAFVDSVDPSPTVRLDLMGANWRTMLDGTDFGMPELRRAVAGTLLTDGQPVTAAAWGNRVITLALNASHLSADDAATQLQLLMRELDRPHNWLRFTGDTTEAITYRTLRSGPSAVRWNKFAKQVTVRILANYSGYGDKEVLSPVTVVNDPAAGMLFNVTDVKGDWPTPLFMKIPETDVDTLPGPTMAFGVRRRGDPTQTPFVLQAENMGLGTDTTVQANDATMSGAGSNFVRTTFATPAMTSRLSQFHPSTSTTNPDNRGTYRCFLRYRKSTALDVVKVRLRCELADGTFITGETRTLANTIQRRWVDLGLWQIPIGAAPIEDGFSGVPLDVVGQMYHVEAERTSGAGNLDMDVLVWLPADDRLAMVSWPSALGAGVEDYVLDGNRNEAYGIDPNGAVTVQQFIPIVGGLPHVSPGNDNRIYVLYDVGGARQDSLTDSVTITPYYWPQYVHVRPELT